MFFGIFLPNFFCEDSFFKSLNIFNTILLSGLGIFIPLLTILLNYGFGKIPVNIIHLYAFEFIFIFLIPIIWISAVSLNLTFNHNFFELSIKMVFIIYVNIISIILIMIFKIIFLSNINDSIIKIIIMYKNNKKIMNNKILAQTLVNIQENLDNVDIKELLKIICEDTLNNRKNIMEFLFIFLKNLYENGFYTSKTYVLNVILHFFDEKIINIEELNNLLANLINNNLIINSDYEANKNELYKICLKEESFREIIFKNYNETLFDLLKNHLRRNDLTEDYLEFLLIKLNEMKEYLFSEESNIYSFNFLHLEILSIIRNKNKKIILLKNYLKTYRIFLFNLTKKNYYNYFFEYLDPSYSDFLVEIFIEEDKEVKTIILLEFLKLGVSLMNKFENSDYKDLSLKNSIERLMDYIFNNLLEPKIIFEIFFYNKVLLDFEDNHFLTPSNKNILLKPKIIVYDMFKNYLFLIILMSKIKIFFNDEINLKNYLIFNKENFLSSKYLKLISNFIEKKDFEEYLKNLEINIEELKIKMSELIKDSDLDKEKKNNLIKEIEENLKKYFSGLKNIEENFNNKISINFETFIPLEKTCFVKDSNIILSLIPKNIQDIWVKLFLERFFLTIKNHNINILKKVFKYDYLKEFFKSNSSYYSVFYGNKIFSNFSESENYYIWNLNKKLLGSKKNALKFDKNIWVNYELVNEYNLKKIDEVIKIKVPSEDSQEKINNINNNYFIIKISLDFNMYYNNKEDFEFIEFENR